MDRVSKEQRSEIMRAVKREGTSAEMRVRKMAHRLGLRFRLHRQDLPGTPDLVFPKYGTCIFVHGCFWHRHAGCRRATIPKSNKAYWTKKFLENVARDKRVKRSLKSRGWKVVTIWECRAMDDSKLEKALRSSFTDLNNNGTKVRLI